MMKRILFYSFALLAILPSLEQCITASKTGSSRPTHRAAASSKTNNNVVNGCGAVEQQQAGPTFGVVSRSTASLCVRGGDVIEVKTLDETQDIISKADGKLVVIDFTASWCGPCKLIAPIYKEFSDLEEFSGVAFLKVDVDENADTAKEYDVSAMPTFIF
mmetsp:Transcript_23817/g.34139  ORF Transcript_23817/g.34139 Transcript_23817/m.34139 type:complete len:160 (-) Transcript_23817:10-489(-)